MKEKKNNKKLLRIPYTDIKQIDDILDDYLKNKDHIVLECSDCIPYMDMLIETYQSMLRRAPTQMNLPSPNGCSKQ